MSINVCGHVDKLCVCYLPANHLGVHCCACRGDALMHLGRAGLIVFARMGLSVPDDPMTADPEFQRGVLIGLNQDLRKYGHAETTLEEVLAAPNAWDSPDDKAFAEAFVRYAQESL